jgi:hypothetical protein
MGESELSFAVYFFEGEYRKGASVKIKLKLSGKSLNPWVYANKRNARGKKYVDIG